ncbi:MAG: NAD(P)-dependent alcohol dehydrogenase [Planctomycetota bacterium]
MRAYQVVSPDGPSALQAVDLPEPQPGPGEIAVAIRAASLNYRDLLVANGGYPRNDRRPVVPLSDGAGEVTAVGDGVTRWKVGDRVAPNFMRDWLGGAIHDRALNSSLGGGIDGVLAETVVLPEASVVAIPEHLSFTQASALPCAALTAWNALNAAGVGAGDTVLLLGTGGVSIFGLQFAKAMGATAIVTSSSDDKLDRAKQLGADHTVNYKQHPEWHEPVRRLTADRGVDAVLEVGGAGTLERSLQAVRIGGHVALIGLLAKTETQPSILSALLNAQTIHGIYVGSVETFEAMNRAITAHRLEPVIDRNFSFDDAIAAYDYFASQRHLGKVIIEF